MSDGKPIQRRTFLKASGTAAATVALAGCSSGGDDGSDDDGGDNNSSDDGMDDGNTGDDDGGEMEEFEVSITQGNMPSGLDPHDHRETPTDVVMLHAYEGVLNRDASGQVQNRLATEYERVEDGHSTSASKTATHALLSARMSSSTTATTSRPRMSPTRSTVSSTRRSDL